MMIVEFALANLFIGVMELHTSPDLQSGLGFVMNNRTVISTPLKENRILQKLNDSDPLERARALNDLTESNSEMAFEFLVVALEDSDYRVRGIAAMNLGKIEYDEAIPYLIHSLTDEHYTVRASAALSLGRLKAEESIQYLIHALKDTYSTVRLAATYSLGILEASDAETPLLKMISDESAEVRENAAWVLGLLKSRKALPYLELLVQDPDERVRNSAKKAIFYIKYDMISDTSSIEYMGGSGNTVEDAVIIRGVKNSFACLRSQKEFINKFYGDRRTWEQLDQKHVKHNNRHYDLIIVKENESGDVREFYFDISELFSEN